MEIPKGNTQADIKARRQIIKDFYASWVAEHPDKRLWNNSLNAFIHVKYHSLNEILGHAPRSYESTMAFTQMTDILMNASYVESHLPKHNDKNQKIYSSILLLRWQGRRLLVGLQKTTDEYVLYYISGGQTKKEKSRQVATLNEARTK